MPKFDLPDHDAKILLVSCMEDRLVQADASTVASHGGGFEVRVAGGPLALLHPEHRQTLLDQITIAQQVDAHELIILRAHIGCGYADLFKNYLGCDTSSAASTIFKRLDHAAEEVKNALIKALGDGASRVTIKLEVVEPTLEAKILKDRTEPVNTGRVA